MFCFPLSVVVFLGASSGFKTKMQDLMAENLISERRKLSREDCQLLNDYFGQRSWKRALNVYEILESDSAYEVLVPWI